MLPTKASCSQIAGFAFYLSTCILLLIPASHLMAAERPPRISQEQIIQRLMNSWEMSRSDVNPKSSQDRPLSRVAHLSNVEIWGADLLAALADPRLEQVLRVRVSNARIEGGLDFSNLPKTPLEDLPLSPAYVQASKYQGIMAMSVLHQALHIEQSTLTWSRGDFITLGAANVYFHRPFELHGVEVNAPADYGENNFYRAVFAQGLSLVDTQLHGSVDLSQAVSEGEVRIENFQGTVLLGQAQLQHDLFVKNLRGSLWFSFASIAGNTWLQGKFEPKDAVLFKPMLVANHTHFAQDVYADVDVGYPALFDFATFDGVLALSNSFFTDLSLKNIEAKTLIELRDTQIHSLLLDNDSQNLIEARVDGRNAKIGHARLRNVVFAKDVDFSDALFGRGETAERVEAPSLKPDGLAMSYATFEGALRLRRAILTGEVSLSNVVFNRSADMTDATFPSAPGSLAMAFVNTDQIQWRWHQLPEVAAAQDAERRSRLLSQLESDFRSRGLLDDANAAYFAAKTAALEEVRAAGEGDWFAEFEWMVWGLPTGYGTKLLPPVLMGILVWVAFALIYLGGSLQRLSQPTNEGEFNLRLRLLEMPHSFFPETVQSSNAQSKWLNALRLSAVLTFKIGFRDISVAGSVLGINLRWVVRVHWLLGFYVLGAIAVTLANTQPFINKLLTGLF